MGWRGAHRPRRSTDEDTTPPSSTPATTRGGKGNGAERDGVSDVVREREKTSSGARERRRERRAASRGVAATRSHPSSARSIDRSSSSSSKPSLLGRREEKISLRGRAAVAFARRATHQIADPQRGPARLLRAAVLRHLARGSARARERRARLARDGTRPRRWLAHTFIRGHSCRAIDRFDDRSRRGRARPRRDDETPRPRARASGTTMRRGRAMRVSRVRVPRAGMPRADVAAARVSSFILFRDDIRSAYYAQAMKSYEQTVRPLRMSLTGQLRVRRLTTTSKKRGRQLTFRLERDWMSGSNERCRAVCGVNESDEK